MILLKDKSQDVDITKAIDNVGGNRFNLVLIASARAREIANQRNLVSRNDSSAVFNSTVCTQALNDVANGTVEIPQKYKKLIK